MKQIGIGKRYLIRTYGCQMNVHDTENMAGILEELGFTSTDDTNEADVILLNTCAIRENAENKVFGEIGHLKSLKVERPEVVVGICGCMSQEESVVNKIMQKHNHVDLILVHITFTDYQNFFTMRFSVKKWSLKSGQKKATL